MPPALPPSVAPDADLHAELPRCRAWRDCPATVKVGCVEKFCRNSWRLRAEFGAKSDATAEDAAESTRAVLNQIKVAKTSVKKLACQAAAGASVPPRPGGFNRLSPPSEVALKARGVGDLAEAAAEGCAGLHGAFGSRVAAADA